uniref:Uncharacterized protein n=1 Tax=Physcomitrium patens TaxID=3218 RepID=A0A2K1IYF8_PHYPA|nr:hypothetical protein PHYPA_024130 [Physcomitrium patens]
MVWLGILNYGWVEWSTICKYRKSKRASSAKLALRFKKRWCYHGVFSLKVEGHPQWVLSGPMAGFVFEPP